MKTLQFALAVLLLIVSGCSSSDDSDKDSGANNTNNANAQTDDGAADDTEPDQKSPPLDEFGKPCATPDECTEPYFCVYPTEGKRGFCTKQCTSQGEACSNPLPGTLAYCIMEDPSGKFGCAFICRHDAFGDQKCPDDLVCPDHLNPPFNTSGQHLCEPEE